MKTKIKLFTIFGLLFLTSGCSIEYNLTINDDSSVNESVVAIEQTDRMEARTKLKGEQAINYLYNMFVPDEDRFSLNYKEENKTTEATVDATYDNIEKYASSFKSDIFDSINITKNKDQITLYTAQKKKLGGYDPSSLIYDDITINLKVPFDVVSNNADSVKGNTYTWNIDKNSNVKTIEITYKDKSLKDQATVSINNKKYNFKYEYIVLGVAIIFIFGIVVFVMINNKRNNIV